jgi:hypothetical protein
MIRRGKFGSGLIIAFLLLSTLSAAQEKPVEIKLTIKYNDRTVAAPDHITLSSPGRVATVTVTNGKFDVPTEISLANTWCLAATIVGSQIRMCSLSRGEFAYENWTLSLADRRYKDSAYAVPKGAEIRSSCMLVLDSQFIDPGLVVFRTHCRSKG